MKNPLLPEPSPLAIWIKDLSRIICRWKYSTHFNQAASAQP
ncbi:hypothetical protein PTRG_04989 [Pyrenophora tritici-repentis Pt-1C-BFP]|uniref:Uncharacterized protein n=1 Tax=Pyrenophora tritici-repentis (strain Pt-1C-BFP) TaxID=426418 RepID=B2W3D9_PYRTR|nr:uncharacterized protein PTRG_04745 [Pyrenophora tritici-repentis Pt-1C-BFP]XP_001935322.1 uncharacterized protein PTRG_04989 [Pyrenophora tritici-repentis Pt-1C-BFP]XP_001939993.1 uncharacterized protein PTRG_09661 [Pyrenophora tritici-repentis Pt-1C-BFP]EDU42712.1 hypothetical protein PTRG_09661 [Pyrenophora tritici-repentis Pt-1C-BFP]EDU47652.1 hypothetical protein PTRG_04745 [Pyrenophora tritici-repentis Pt-1C-BFP]EDU47896.1 hypothetical protein PTRG_04989 [Pyrenophora tritici-repentis P